MPELLQAWQSIHEERPLPGRHPNAHLPIPWRETPGTPPFPSWAPGSSPATHLPPAMTAPPGPAMAASARPVPPPLTAAAGGAAAAREERGRAAAEGDTKAGGKAASAGLRCAGMGVQGGQGLPWGINDLGKGRWEPRIRGGDVEGDSGFGEGV